MLQLLVAWSLKQRVIVIVLAALVLALGIHATLKARLDVFPEFAPPQVEIQTECPGLAPVDVEQLVTIPIELAVNGVPRLAALRSKSVQGLSAVTVIFEDRADIYRARQQVNERLSELAGQLPAGVKPPRVEPLKSSTARLLSVGFTSVKLSPLDLRDKVQWLVRPKLLIPGVAQITVMGGDVRQFQVQVDPDKLAARQLTMTDVLDTVRQASGVRGAGFIENEQQRFNLRSEGQIVDRANRLRPVAELDETVISNASGVPVRLKDVAVSREGAEPKFGDAQIDGTPGVVLTAYRQLEADTLDTTRRLEAEIEKLPPVLERQGITIHTPLFRQADFIEHAVGNVAHSLWIGAFLVAAVLFLFLFNLRTAFISLTAIPLSLMGAIIVLWIFDIGLNTLTLGGLAIALGEVVDDAIIDVENIFRRLRENEANSEPRPSRSAVFDVVLAASLEVRGAVVYATFVVVLVFVPIFFLSGLQGRLFAPLGLAYVLAVLASLVVALVVTPALSLLLLPGAKGAHEPPLLHWLQGGYDRLLRALDRVWLAGVGAMTVLLALSIFALTQFGGDLLPKLKESHFIIHARGLPGTSLRETMATGKSLTNRLLEDKDKGVRHVTQLAGRAELGEDTWGVEYSEIEVPLNRARAADIGAAEDWLKATAAQTPGVSTEVFTFLTERIKELSASGTAAALAINVHGESLYDIERTAEDIARTLNTVQGRANVRVEAQTGAPEFVVRIRARDAARYGFRRVQVLDAVQTAFQGAEVGQVYHGVRTIDLRVLLDEKSRRDPYFALKKLWLTAPALEKNAEPTRITLEKVADVFPDKDGRFLIAHEGGLRRQMVTCNVDQRDITSFANEAKDKLDQLKLPDGVFFTLTGEHEARATALRELLFWSALSGVGIFVLLWLAYGSIGRVCLILANLPFALVGGVIAVSLIGGTLDVGSLIGFVTLFGITMRNSMMMVSHWQHLHDEEKMAWGPELIFRGARERLAPVLMTALVTGLGLLPIAWGRAEAGREIEGPMACVILGGLASSTVLNLIFLPILYRRVSSQ